MPPLLAKAGVVDLDRAPGNLDFALRGSEHLFEIMTMRWGVVTGRDVYVDEIIQLARMTVGGKGSNAVLNGLPGFLECLEHSG